jgi:polysaccharide export outer membrane protein
MQVGLRSALRMIATGLIALGWAACSEPPANYPEAGMAEVEDETLGVGDRIEVRVYFGSQEKTSEYSIASTGNISVWFIGEVQAAGKTQAELEQSIQAKLADGYLVNPVVSVDVKEARSKKVSVLGEVKRPGTLAFIGGMTIIDALAQAGGLTPMARKNSVKVTRIEGSKKRAYTVPVKSIAGNRAAMFTLMPGDVVFVPERRW